MYTESSWAKEKASEDIYVFAFVNIRGFGKIPRMLCKAKEGHL